MFKLKDRYLFKKFNFIFSFTAIGYCQVDILRPADENAYIILISEFRLQVENKKISC